MGCLNSFSSHLFKMIRILMARHHVAGAVPGVIVFCVTGLAVTRSIYLLCRLREQ